MWQKGGSLFPWRMDLTHVNEIKFEHSTKHSTNSIGNIRSAHGQVLDIN